MTQITAIKGNGQMSETIMSDKKAKQMLKFHKMFGRFSRTIYVAITL